MTMMSCDLERSRSWPETFKA